MPLSVPAPGVLLDDVNFTTPLKTFVDGVETTANSAQATANAAQSKANAAYAKPANGIPLADLDPAVQATIGNRAYLFPYPMRVDARASLGLQGAARPDSPIVTWALDVGQPTPAAVQTGTDPKFPGDDLVYV